MLKVVASLGATSGALSYQGTWDAATNNPALVSSTGTQGYYYVVSVAGSTNLDGITDWQVNDWAIFNGTTWQKIDNSDLVQSVNGQTGVVVLTAANVGATPNTTYVNVGTGLSGGGQLVGNVSVALANTAVTAGTYGDAANVAQVTVDAQGRLTAASNVAISIPSTQVTGLGTMATQNASNVTITGGTLTSNVNLTGNTSNTATFATDSLPLVPEGYVEIQVGGSTKKIPYYGV